jgi:selenocysteine-specific elongation factor
VVLWVEQARERGVSEEALAMRAGVAPAAAREALAPALAEGRLHALRRSPDRYVSEAVLAALSTRAGKLLQGLLSAGGVGVGVSRGTLLQRLLAGAEPRWAEAVEAALVSRGVLAIAGDEARLPGKSDLAGPERDLSERIVALFRQGGLDPPSPIDVARAVKRHVKVVEGLIGYLVKKGELARLPGGWIVAKSTVDDVAARLRASGKPSLDVGEFKEMFGLTRRLAIPLLEYLDSTKVTRRVGDRREVL